MSVSCACSGFEARRGGRRGSSRRSPLVVAAVVAVAVVSASCSPNDAVWSMLGMPNRQAMRERAVLMKERLASSSFLVVPPVVRRLPGQEGDQQLPATSSEAVATRLQPFCSIAVAMASAPNLPVPRHEFGYRWFPERIGHYSDWIRETRPDADYVLAIEMDPRSALIWTFDRGGELVDMTALHWGQSPPGTGEQAAEMIVERFRDNLAASGIGARSAVGASSP